MKSARPRHGDLEKIGMSLFYSYWERQARHPIKTNSREQQYIETSPWNVKIAASRYVNSLDDLDHKLIHVHDINWRISTDSNTTNALANVQKIYVKKTTYMCSRPEPGKRAHSTTRRHIDEINR